MNRPTGRRKQDRARYVSWRPIHWSKALGPTPGTISDGSERSATAMSAGARLARQLYIDGCRGEDGVCLVPHLNCNRHAVAAVAMDRRVDDPPADEGSVSGERRIAVLRLRVRDKAPLADPRRDVVDHPRAHRRAIAARETDVLRPPGLEVAARRAVVGAVRELRVGALHAPVAFEAGHLLGVAELFGAHRGRALRGRAPDGHRVSAPLSGEARQTVRPEDVAGQLVTDGDRLEVSRVVSEAVDLLDEDLLLRVEIR